MCTGSKITEGIIGAVLVSGINSVFKMEGGEISGNYSSSSTGGVEVSNGGTFEMKGGSIINNSRILEADDLFIAHESIFRLSGSARIGTLMLYANSATARSSVNINSNYSCTVNRLHLRYIGIVNSYTIWTNAPVILNGTVDIISMFNNGLGDLDGGFSKQSISATHIINANGVLVLKED